MTIYRAFDLLGNALENRLAREAIDSCSFPWELVQEKLMREQNKRYIPVLWSDINSKGVKFETHNGEQHAVIEVNGQEAHVEGDPDGLFHFHYVDENGVEAEGLGYERAALGLFWLDGRIEINNALALEDPELARIVFVAEGAHLIDYYYMSPYQRRVIYNAFHFQTEQDIAPHWHDGAPIPDVEPIDSYNYTGIMEWGHPRTSWMKPETEYLYRVGESFMEAFLLVYTDLHGSSFSSRYGFDQFKHQPTYMVQTAIARVLTPWLLELYPQEQLEGGNAGVWGSDYVPPTPTDPTDPVVTPPPVAEWGKNQNGWPLYPILPGLLEYYATQKERRFHYDHRGYQPDGRITYATREDALAAGKVPCPQCRP